MAHTIDIDSLVQQIADALVHCDGEYVAEIANQVLADEKVTYLHDSFFTIERSDIEKKEE